MNLAERIKGKLKRQRVEIPEWDEPIWVRELSAAEAFRLREKSDEEQARHLFFHAVVEENGAQIFDKLEDVDAFLEVASVDAINRIGEAIASLRPQAQGKEASESDEK